MKRKGNESEIKTEATQVSSPPISESTTAKTPETTTATVETVTVPPITETAAPVVKPPETTTAPVETITAPPVSELETLANEPTETATTAQPTAATLPPPGRGSRTFEDYLKLDWTKSNSDLATECNVSRQAIAQMRKKVETFKTSGGKMPTFADVTKPEAPIAEKIVDYEAMSAMVFDMSTGILTMTFGNEWQPKPAQEPGKPGERDVVVAALANYFRSQQVTDIPPGLMLTVVCVAYAGPRLREPNTSSKLKMGWTWLRLKISNLRKKKN